MGKVGNERALNFGFVGNREGKWPELRDMARKKFKHWSMDRKGSGKKRELWIKRQGVKYHRSQ